MKLTGLLAIYAAVLSTIVFVWNVSHARPRVKVRLVPGVERVDEECRIGVYISVHNTSAHTVHLSNVISLLYPYRRVGIRDRLSDLIRFRRLPRFTGWVHSSLSNWDVEDKCPVSVEARRSHDVFVPKDVLERVLKDAVRREIRAVVQDQLWQNTYLGRLTIDWDGNK